MTKYGPRRTVPYRRAREGKTDYRYRSRLLRSENPRLVSRISLKNVRAQLVKADPKGDHVVASAFSKELSEFGWKGYNSNTPAAYLVGLLCGYRAIGSDVDEAVLDIDKFVSSPQAKVFAVCKGVLDAGLYIPHGEQVLPAEERCRGEHISDYAESLKEDGDKYQAQFSKYLENDLPPEDLPEHFKEVKEAITNQYGD